MKTQTESTQSNSSNYGNKSNSKIFNIAKFENGTKIDGKYEIKREISRGGMGIVYEAYDNASNRQVAIKIILANKIDTLQLRRFEKEIEACARLSHPNVIKIYDAGTYENNPYIVMEYIDGVNICEYVAQHDEAQKNKHAKLEKRNKRDWKLCARLIYETALGLEYIHKQRMFHRDIKPSNIIVRSNGSPVIIDLGLVKFNQERSYNLTRSRDILGTCQYMPIEQAQGKRGEIDARTDVYSLGLVLYELLTEQQAYTGKNMIDVFNKIVSYYPPMPREINPQIPEILEEITIHATEKQKEKRYATAQEFADALKQYLNNTNAQATSQYAYYKKRLWLQRNKNKMLVCCIALLLIGIIAISMLQKQKVSFVKNDVSPKSQNQEKISIQNDAERQYKLGLMYEKGTEVKKDDTKAFEWYQKAAMQGHIEAQKKLAAMYYIGAGVKKNLKKSFEWFEKLALQGDSIAQQNLAIMYENGEGVKQDLKKAFYWYEKLASQGNATVQETLGWKYYTIMNDIEKAIYWSKKAAEQDNIKAKYNLGQIYFNEKNYIEAHKWYEQAANEYYAVAQYMLGIMYTDGLGIKQDLDKANFWFKKAYGQYNKKAEQGDSISQFRLAQMYQYGQGVQQDLEKARYWYEKAAKQGNSNAQLALDNINLSSFQYLYERATKQGDANAQFRLAQMYENGQDVQQDSEKARYWYEKAANQGNSNAQYHLGYSYYIQKDYKTAFYWLEKSANQNNADAQDWLGVLYKEGQGVPQDLKKMREWYEKAANQGHAQAQYHLGVVYQWGLGVEKNIKKGFEYFQKGANGGHEIAQHNVGAFYYERKAGKQDLAKAFYWFEKAANQGFDESQFLLGAMYENGESVNRNLEKARYWYEQATNQGHEKAKQRLNEIMKKK